MGKIVSVRDNECSAYMSSMRVGQGDMVRDLPRGAIHVLLRKISLEESDMFTRHFEIVLIVSSCIYTFSCIDINYFGVLTRTFIF